MSDVASSNVTQLSLAEETSPGVLPGTPTWRIVEANSYPDFGADVELRARSPINADRQRKKGVPISMSAGFGVNVDLTSRNIDWLLQGFFMANLRTKKPLTGTAATVSGFTVAADGDDYLQNDLIHAYGADTDTNNGLKVVGSGSTGTNVAVTGLTAEAAQTIELNHVGFQFTTGDAEIDASGSLPALITTTKNLTQLGLIPGEIIYIGGDTVATQFANDSNNGWARVKSVTANAITFDKATAPMITDDGSGKTIRIFFGKVLKNEQQSLMVERSYTAERSLGAPDPGAPAEIQGEYLDGSVANQVVFDMGEEELARMTMTFISRDYYTRDGATGLRSGNRPAIEESDAFNTSGDIVFNRMAVYEPGNEAPTPLFAIINEWSLTLNNGYTRSAGQGFLGAAALTPGFFTVSGEVTAYFATVAAQEAVRASEDATFCVAAWRANRGVAWDMPMIGLGGGRATITANRPITIPLDLQAATGAKYDSAMNHTLLMVFFDYLPDRAGVRV